MTYSISGEFYQNAEVIEGIGDLQGLYRLISKTVACDNFRASLNGLRCYVHPNHGKYQIGNFACEYVSSIDNTNSEIFRISPNPANDYIKIQHNFGSNLDAKVFVVSNLGEIMLTKDFNTTQQIELNVSALLSGIYFVRVQVGSKSETRKLIKF